MAFYCASAALTSQVLLKLYLTILILVFFPPPCVQLSWLDAYKLLACMRMHVCMSLQAEDSTQVRLSRAHLLRAVCDRV